jgi:catalase
VTGEMKSRIVEYWTNIDEDLGRKVAEGIGAE